MKASLVIFIIFGLTFCGCILWIANRLTHPLFQNETINLHFRVKHQLSKKKGIIYQNSWNGGNCHQTEWNEKRTTPNIKRSYNTSNTYGEADGKTWSRLKHWLQLWVFENLLTLQFFKVYFVVCKVWCNALETVVFVWHEAVIFSFPSNFSSSKRIRTCNWYY